jgi:20S proteasome alpha/beta subunit
MKLMTLIVTLKSDKGIVLAGDKRSYEGTASQGYIDTATKILRLNDKVAIGGAGDGFESKEIINTLKDHPKIAGMNVEEVRKLLFDKTRERQAQWYTRDNMKLMQLGIVNTPSYGFILVGYNAENEAKIYGLTYASNSIYEIPENYTELGIIDVAKYLFLENYKETFDLDEMADLAKLSIEATNKISLSVSKVFDLIKIDPPVSD